MSRSAIRLELLVFVEGQRTEETYLVGWRRLYRDRVLVTIDDFRGAPLSLVQHAIEAQRREAYEARRGRGRPHDQIWCVFDVDQHPNIPEALALAAQHKALADDDAAECAGPGPGPAEAVYFCLSSPAR